MRKDLLASVLQCHLFCLIAFVVSMPLAPLQLQLQLKPNNNGKMAHKVCCAKERLDSDWSKFSKSFIGIVDDIYIRQIERKDQNGDAVKLGLFQGNLITNQLKLVPTPDIDPHPGDGIAGFRSITLSRLQQFKQGMDEEILGFLGRVVNIVAAAEEAYNKFQLLFALAYAFKGDEEAIFRKNLAKLLDLPAFRAAMGSLAYSEGGNLAEFLTRFPELKAPSDDWRRLDVHVYAENDVLVEDYYKDVAHWLKADWANKSKKGAARQVRLKFVQDREDNAQEMLTLLKKDFDEKNESAEQHPYVIRFDGGFELEPFCIENEKSGEMLTLVHKEERVLSAEIDPDEKWNEPSDESREKRKRICTKSAEEKESANQPSDGNEEAEQKGEANKQEDEDEEEKVHWRSYLLVRAAKDAQLDELLAANPMPVLGSTFRIMH